jgi:hypothetical protein
MNLKYLDEPELEFGVSSHIDIKFGIMNYGVLDSSEEDAPRKIHLGLVGVNDDIETFLGWVERCRNKIPGKESRKKNLFPPFPGFTTEHGFYSEIVTNQNIQRALGSAVFQGFNGLTHDEKIRKAVEIYVSEIEYLSSKKNHKVDVILCAIPRILAEVFAADLASEDGDEPEDEPQIGVVKSKIDFRKLLKAETLKFRIPIQIILPSTYDGTGKKMRIGTHAEGSLQDEATRAWNFYTALYYKAGGVPWRLIRNPQEYQTCYVGISFYRSLDEETIQTSVAQVFNERGEGLIIRGANAKRSKYDKQIHLESEGAKNLLRDALAIYLREHKTRPARVVIHKTSDYDQNEIDGFLASLNEEKITLFDFLSVSKSLTRLHRNGKYPPLRGTFWELDDETKILYTKGSVDLFQTYPGLYIPKSLKIRIAFKEQSSRFLANEILALTKMNWNNTQLDNSMPITIKAARQVGDILKYVPEDGYVESSYSFYM